MKLRKKMIRPYVENKKIATWEFEISYVAIIW